MPSVDELLSALPQVGLRLVNMCEHTGATPWGVQLRDNNGAIWDGGGDTPAGALVSALQTAGIHVDDSD